MASEQFSLCWDNFHKNMSSGMNSLLENEDLVDVTLAVEGKCLKAHKMVLSVCSPYFKELFKSNPCQHPIVFMKDVSYVAISDLLQFMYQGEVQVSQENLTTFIKTAEALQIKGLTGDGNGNADDVDTPTDSRQSAPSIDDYRPAPKAKKQPPPTPVVTATPAPKRPRLDPQPAAPPVLTKQEPAASLGVDAPPIQFKMEPYDGTASGGGGVGGHGDADEDNFGDDALDDNTVDDTEDYSMMEGGDDGGGGEPQAGTSADGAGEGQGVAYFDINSQNLTMYLNEYDYFLSEKRRSGSVWRCSKFYTEGQHACKSKILTRRRKVEIINAHSHNPETQLPDHGDFLVKKVKVVIRNY